MCPCPIRILEPQPPEDVDRALGTCPQTRCSEIRPQEDGEILDPLKQLLDDTEALIDLLEMAIHNLQHPDDPRNELTMDAVELLTVPADLAEYRGAIAAALQHGTKRSIETVPAPKDQAKDT